MFRALLASTVTGKGNVKRGGRRLLWLAEVLEPLRPKLPPAEFKRLVCALSLMGGIETVVVLKDICGLDDGEAEEVTLWAANALLAGVLARVD